MKQTSAAGLFVLFLFLLPSLAPAAGVNAVLIFPKNRHTLDTASLKALEGLSRQLSNTAEGGLEIRGYADDSGRDGVNLWVSTQRALAVKNALLRLGIPASVFGTVAGYGKAEPVADNSSEDGSRLNRRVDLYVNAQKLDLLPLVSDETAVVVPAPAPAAAPPVAVAAAEPVSPTAVPVEAAAAPLSPAAAPITIAAAVVVTPLPTPAPTVLAQAPQAPSDQDISRFALGIGYPDLRARLALTSRLDVEAKVAMANTGEAYSGRAYFRTLGLGPLDLGLGGEGGYVNFTQAAGLSGDGWFGEPFVGLEYRFAGRWRVSADIGPAWVDLTSQGVSLGGWQWTYNTALYFYLF